MFHKLIAVVAWGVLAFIVYATVSPIRARPTLIAPATFEHIAAFTILGVLFCLAYPKRIGLICLIVLGTAVTLEAAQLLTDDRHGRIVDVLEKISGGLFGIMLGRAALSCARVNRGLES
jgi:hypothetical protein